VLNLELLQYGLFTTSRITTDWGTCIIHKDEIIVTIEGATVLWQVPGGPWTVEFIPKTEQLMLIPSKRGEKMYHSQIPDFLSELPRQFTLEQLVHKAFLQIDATLFSITEQDVKDLVDKLLFLAQYAELNDHQILQGLLKKVHEEVNYHLTHVDSNFDYRILKNKCSSRGSRINFVRCFLLLLFKMAAE